ncbi:MAG: Xaa-Pro aminopeptidase [SAR86 cluster bacterium]|uniref:Xaa-Pro aminopeptidase n=1 Tax=SAR86 cluster bacterium TaxID=2030880 RepID=A0A2A5B910_9GAMM|nr:MAG: Xaa-Pro aminopeptidase [SAR86 cluster bacterium]
MLRRISHPLISHPLLVLLCFLLSPFIQADTGDSILPMKQRAETIDRFLVARFESLPAKLMRREGIAMWILVAREYNEDPVVMTMLPGDAHAARRRTILVFMDEGAEGVKGYAVSRYGVGDFFKPVWNPEEQPDQWKALSELISEKNPANIAINTSSDFALADGLTQGEYVGLMGALTNEQKNRVQSAENLAISWLEARTAEEMAIYPSIVEIAHDIIEEGFSNEVITPGVTTTDDVMWWYRDRIRELRLVTWFHPSVSIQRADGAEKEFIDLFTDTDRDGVILPGDLLHVDFGITYLRLNTDTQQHAYVLRPGESNAPAGLLAGLKTSNRLQDILTENFKAGRTGNEILRAARAQAIDEDIRPSIYTHPIGYHGHGAGPTIGMWDNQNDTVGKGDFPMHENTAYSIELNATVSVPEWGGQDVRFMLEEDAYFDGQTSRYIDGRQEEFILIESE